MAQITLRKSTTGTVVNHKEESSLRGICNRRGGGFPIPGEPGWTEMFDDFQSACPRPIFIVIWKLTKGWPQPVGQSVAGDGEMIAVLAEA